MKGFKAYIRLILNILIPIGEILLVCLLGPRLLGFFMPFVVGWVVALIANPLVRFLESRVRIVRKHSSVLIVAGVLAAVIGLGYFLISRIIIQAMEFTKDLPELYAVAAAEVDEGLLRLGGILSFLPDNVQQVWQEFTAHVGSSLSQLVQEIASPTVAAAGSVAKWIPAALVNTVVAILASYFFIAEQDKIVGFWRKHLPASGERYYLHVKQEAGRLVGGYFLAQFRIMFVVAALLLIGFLILGVNYAFLLAILMAVLDFLPLFGTGTVLIPWALFKLISGEYALAAGLALLYVLTQVVRQVIQPKIVGDTMGLNPMMTLLFLYLGFKLHGLSGMILAVPVGIFVIDLYHFGAFDSMVGSVKELWAELGKFRRGEK